MQPSTGVARSSGPRLRRAWGCLLAILLLFAPGTLRAERLGLPEPSTNLADVLSTPGDLTLRDTTLTDALLTISEVWGVNVVVGDRVEGQVNGAFKQTSLKEILDSILLTNGYSYRLVGQSLVVKQLKDFGNVNPLFETTTIFSRHLTSEEAMKEAVEGARLLGSPHGKVQPIGSARSVLVIDYPDRVAMIRRFVERLGTQAPDGLEGGPRKVEAGYFETEYIPISSAKEAIVTALSLDGKAATMDEEDRLVVVDYPENLEMVRQMIEQIDVPRKMIRITSFIYDISLEDMETLGVNWSHALKGKPDAAGSTAEWAIDSLTTIPFAATAPGAAITFANMSENFDLTAVIQALNEASDSRLLADPNVTVLENEEAMISIIQEIPFQQLTQTQQGGNIGTTAFRDAGVKLRVKARVSNLNTIRMEVEPEFSRLTGFTPEDNQPIIDRRTAKTTVRVVNGHTLVIGGLRQRTEIGDYKGIPLLMNLPLGVGQLFRSRETSIRESELVVFIRPEIVTFDQTGRMREESALGTTRNLLDCMPPPECPPGYHDEGFLPEALPPVYEDVAPVPDSEALEPLKAETVSAVLSDFDRKGPQVIRIPIVQQGTRNADPRSPVSSAYGRGIPPRTASRSYERGVEPPSIETVQNEPSSPVQDDTSSEPSEEQSAAVLPTTDSPEETVRQAPRATWIKNLFRFPELQPSSHAS